MFGRSAIIILCLVASNAIAMQEVEDFMANLTQEEDMLLVSVFKEKQYDTFDQALDALNAQSEELHDKVVRLRNLITKNVEKLEDNAKKFVKETFVMIASTFPAIAERNETVVRGAINKFLKKYKNLSGKSKGSLKKVFPSVVAFIEAKIARDEEAARFRQYVFRPCRGICYNP